TALADAAPLYRDAPEAREARAAGARVFRAFMREALPGVSDGTLASATELITTTLSAVGKHVSSLRRSDAEVAGYAEAMGDMFCAYWERLEGQKACARAW
ncbi:MAG: TetR/AcrR family transcriptional regulator, partial [Acidisphaera sp.]|nr:TetR/AcrR family transcriptional regulator [Acidisphaera sp.]